MKKMLMLLVFILLTSMVLGDNVNDKIKQAKQIENEDIFKAIDMMEDLYESNPKNIALLSYYGLILSKGAGQANMMKAASLASKAEKVLDQALEIDPEYVDARLNRGILKVNMPKFLGKLDAGIEDLQKVISTKSIPNEVFVAGCYFLAMGYEKNDENSKAIEMYKNVVRYGSETQFIKTAKNKLKELEGPAKDVKNNIDFEKKGDKYFFEKDYVGAYKAYIEAVANDTTSVELYLKYLKAMEYISSGGYPEEVNKDVAFMTDLAFNVADALRHIVRLQPQVEEYRIIKAEVLVQLPFFVQSVEEGVKEALWISKNSKDRSIVTRANDVIKHGKAKAERKILTDKYVASESEEEKTQIIASMQTSETSQAQELGYSTKIIMSLGFGDYIAPQSAVWIEDTKGNYVATVYISGFSAKAKDKQVHLPKWAKSSKFEDSIVQVTGASIDSGVHTFYWNNKDSKGKELRSGDYFVCTEVAHWPHVGYSMQKIKLSLGGKSYYQKVKGDNIITGLTVAY